MLYPVQDIFDVNRMIDEYKIPLLEQFQNIIGKS